MSFINATRYMKAYGIFVQINNAELLNPDLQFQIKILEFTNYLYFRYWNQPQQKTTICNAPLDKMIISYIT